MPSQSCECMMLLFSLREIFSSGADVNRAEMSIAHSLCLLAGPSTINARRKYLSKRLRIDVSVVNCLLSLPSQMSISFRVAPIALSGVRVLFVLFFSFPPSQSSVSFWVTILALSFIVTKGNLERKRADKLNKTTFYILYV